MTRAAAPARAGPRALLRWLCAALALPLVALAADPPTGAPPAGEGAAPAAGQASAPPAAPRPFTPSQSVSSDRPVAFPVDI